VQAYGGGKEKPFCLTIEQVNDQDRGISEAENDEIFLDVMQDSDSSNFNLVTLKNRDQLIEDVLVGKRVMVSQMKSLLNAEGGVNHFIRSSNQNIIEIDPKLNLDQEEIQITCLDLSDSRIGDQQTLVLAEKLLPQLPYLTHLVLRNCQIGAKTAKLLVRILEKNQEFLKRLHWIDISQNQLDMSAVLEWKRVIIDNENSQINKCSFADAAERSLLKKINEKVLVLSKNKFNEEILKAAVVLVEEFKIRKFLLNLLKINQIGQINKEAFFLYKKQFDEEVLKAAKDLVAKIDIDKGKDVIEKKSNNMILLHLNGDIMNLVGPLLELTEEYAFIISALRDGDCQGIVTIEGLENEIILIKNIEQGKWTGRLKELDLMTNFEPDFALIKDESDMRVSEIKRQLSKKVAQGIKNISTKFSVSCLKLTGGGDFSIITINLVEELLKENTFLKELHVNEAGVYNGEAEKIAEALVENQSLEILNLARNEIGNIGSNAFAKLFKENKNSSLKEIDLSYNIIFNIEGWRGFSLEKSSLVKLNFDHNAIGDEEKELFKCLCGNAISLESQKFEREIEKIKNEIEFQNIDISYGQMGNRGVKELVRVLQECTSLVSLDLHGNKIGNVGVETLAQVIKKNIALKELILSSNSIGDKGVKALAAVLMGHPILEYLDLNHNQIGNIGAIEISNKLGKNNNASLAYLYLKNNQIGNIGAEALANAFHAKFFLLDLRKNQIEDKKKVKEIWEKQRIIYL